MMTRRMSGLLATALVGLSVIAADVEAARVGGGRNVGRQNNTVNRDATPQQAPQQSVPPSQQAAPGQSAAAARQTAPAASPAAAAQQPARNRWLGPIAGLAAGLGLAALFSHLGLGAELANFVMIALLVFAVLIVVGLVMARRRAAAQPALAGAGYRNTGLGSEALGSLPPGGMQRNSLDEAGSAQSASSQGAPAFGRIEPSMPSGIPGVPADFDVDGFLKGARQQFVRLQAAFDAADTGMLREFTADELFPELSRQIQERGAAAQRTDVVQLHAELLGIQIQAGDYLASVRFHGMIREVDGAAATAFDEVWNLIKPTTGGSGWLLAGIQQLS